MSPSFTSPPHFSRSTNRSKSRCSLLEYVSEHAKYDSLASDNVASREDQSKPQRNPYLEPLPSSRFFNPFGSRIKEIASYSGKTRQQLYSEHKGTKEINSWLKKMRKRRQLAHIDPSLIPKSSPKEERPRYRVAIMGARGSGRRTLFTQLKRLAEDGRYDAELYGLAADPEVLTAAVLSGALPLIRMNCLADAKTLAQLCEAHVGPEKQELCQQILAAQSWDDHTATNIWDFWCDETIRKAYYRLRHTPIDSGLITQAVRYISSSSPHFLGHVLQYAHHGYIPTVAEYLQAEKVATQFIGGKQDRKFKHQQTAVSESDKSLEKTKRDERIDFTRVLSLEILCALLGWFGDPADLARLSRVNSTLHKATNLPFIWKSLARRYFFPAAKSAQSAKQHFKNYWSQECLQHPKLEEINIQTPNCGLVPSTQFRVVNFGFYNVERRRYLFSRSDDFSALIYMMDVSLRGPALIDAMNDWREVAAQFKTRNRIVFMNKCDVLRDSIQLEKPELTEEQRDAAFEQRLEELEEILIREARKVVRHFFTLSIFRTNSLFLESAMLSMCAVANAIRWNFQWQRQNALVVPNETV